MEGSLSNGIKITGVVCALNIDRSGVLGLRVILGEHSRDTAPNRMERHHKLGK